MIMKNEDWKTHHDILMRLLALKKRGWNCTILAEANHYWLSFDPVAPWDNKTEYTISQLDTLCRDLEVLYATETQPTIQTHSRTAAL